MNFVLNNIIFIGLYNELSIEYEDKNKIYYTKQHLDELILLYSNDILKIEFIKIIFFKLNIKHLDLAKRILGTKCFENIKMLFEEYKLNFDLIDPTLCSSSLYCRFEIVKYILNQNFPINKYTLYKVILNFNKNINDLIFNMLLQKNNLIDSINIINSALKLTYTINRTKHFIIYEKKYLYFQNKLISLIEIYNFQTLMICNKTKMVPNHIKIIFKYLDTN